MPAFDRYIGIDYFGRGDLDVEWDVVRQHRDLLLHDLQGMDRGHDRRRLLDLPFLAEQRVLEVGEPAAFADARAVATHAHRAADDEIDRAHLARAHQAPVLG